MEKYITILNERNEEIGEIVLKNDAIKVNGKKAKSINDMLESWQKGYFGEKYNTDKKLFEVIPELMSRYTRIFCSNIKERD